MLVQTPSRIFKSDFATWFSQGKATVRTLFKDLENSQLQSVSEIIIDENGFFEFNSEKNTTTLIVTVYGNVCIDKFTQLNAQKVLTVFSAENQTIRIDNELEDEKSDVLIFEFHEDLLRNSVFTEELIIDNFNRLIPISQKISVPNFIGLYGGREEVHYSTKTSTTIFGIVLNGVFEFQNRLMETRDAILLWKINELEFESLSNDGLILFFEIQNMNP